MKDPTERFPIRDFLQSLHGFRVSLSEGHCLITGEFHFQPEPNKSWVETKHASQAESGHGAAFFKNDEVERVIIARHEVEIVLEDGQ